MVHLVAKAQNLRWQRLLGVPLAGGGEGGGVVSDQPKPRPAAAVFYFGFFSQ